MKECITCNKLVNDKSIECIYCSGKKFDLAVESSTATNVVKENGFNEPQGTIYSKKLEKLIEIALSDGELTEKEKLVLFKQAEQEGVDLNELEFVLDAKLASILSSQQKHRDSKNNEKDSRQNLDNLIDLALADGVITEKERNVLMRKAKIIGIERDEFDLILDGKLTNYHKKGLDRTKGDNVMKCPSCNDIIPALSRVCPSCEFVLDSRKKSSNSEKGLEELIDEIEDNLVLIKSQLNKSVLNSLVKHSYLSFPLFSIVLMVLGFRFTIGSPLFLLTLIGSVFLIIISAILVRRKFKTNSNKSDDYNAHKALFEKHSRTASTLFGENKKVKLLLSDLEIELNDIDQYRRKQKKIEYIAYIVLFSVSIGLMFLPTKKSEQETINELRLADRDLILEAEQFIDNNSIDEARKLIPKLNAETSVVLIKSKIQLSELLDKLENIEQLLEKKEYSKIKLELDKIVWQKISTEYSTESVERDIYKTFLQKKEAINNQLPEKFKVKVGSEYSL